MVILIPESDFMNSFFKEGFFDIEDDLLLYIQSLRCDILDHIMIFITTLGDKGFIWIAAAIVLLFFKNQRKIGAKVLTALIINTVIVNLILKPLIMRPRPFDVIEGLETLIPAPQDWSFPSGHTSSSFAAGLVLIMGLPSKYGIPAMPLAILIAVSRIYVGVHYPSDIIAGAIFGILFGLAADILVDNISNRRLK